MNPPRIVSRAEWTSAREQFLAREKEFTRLRDQLCRERRALPWVEVEKPYRFEGPEGRLALADLFAGRRQLVVYHFMFPAEWEVGCKSCSFWADHFDGVLPHLKARDVSLAVVSRGPLEKLRAQARRLGWNFRWVSSAGSDFNYDFEVSFEPEALASGETRYNYARQKLSSPDMPGVSVFYKDDDGRIFHTYSCYGRGIEALNTTYQILDLVPKGRDEEGLPHTMSWVRHHDLYPA